MQGSQPFNKGQGLAGAPVTVPGNGTGVPFMPQGMPGMAQGMPGMAQGVPVMPQSMPLMQPSMGAPPTMPQGMPMAPPGGGVPLMNAGMRVPGVPTPPYPGGVQPGITQYPAAPPGLPFRGMGQQPGPTGFPGPAIMPTPGPSTFGTSGPTGSIGGVPGVSLAPVAGIAPPATTGGPHPLPPMPQVPLPQGFPNPFSTDQVPMGGRPPAGPYPASAAGPSMWSTGPAGLHPGLGNFPLPGPAAIPPGVGMMPGPGQFPAGAQRPQPMAFGPAPAFQVPPAPAFQVPPAPVYQAPPGPANQPQPKPSAQGATTPPGAAFWQHLAWQLIQTDAMKEGLGAQFDELVTNKHAQALQAAVECLMGDELQSAFRDLTAGRLDQARFLEQFARSVAGRLRPVAANPADPGGA